MAQLPISCNVNKGSQLVTVPGQDVSAQIKTSNIFMVAPYTVPYFVTAAALFNGTDTTFTLTGAYQGASATLASAIVARDATIGHSIPLINPKDVGTAAIFTAAMYQIEAIFNGGVPIVGAGGGGPSSTDGLPEGLQNLYFTATRMRSTPLTGVQVASSPNGYLTAAQLLQATDTLLAALGKLNVLMAAHQGQGDGQHALVSQISHGFMSASDKTKLDGLSAGGGGGGGISLTVGPTAPASPVHGQEWIDTNTGTRYTYTVDADSSQWVAY